MINTSNFRETKLKKPFLKMFVNLSTIIIVARYIVIIRKYHVEISFKIKIRFSRYTVLYITQNNVRVGIIILSTNNARHILREH